MVFSTENKKVFFFFFFKQKVCIFLVHTLNLIPMTIMWKENF